jgi:extradiol dioxygenase family protein
MSASTKTSVQPFHLAFPVSDLAAAKEFYAGRLGCPMGRSSDRWIDFDFFGHQLVAHLVADARSNPNDPDSNPVDGHDVPIPHFGVVLEWTQWEKLAERLKSAGTKFVIEPYVRFAGQPGEQATMFFLDPSGNALEFKAFRDIGQMFAT